MLDETLSWIIALGNPITGLLVGPTVETFWGPTPSRRVARLGWLGLFVTQLTFLAFGYASGYVAFRVAQPCMLPVACWNYYLTTSRWARQRRTHFAELTVTVTVPTTVRPQAPISRSTATTTTQLVTTTASELNGTRELRARTFRQA